MGALGATCDNILSIDVVTAEGMLLTILGFTMIGAEAGEVMAVVQTAMPAAVPYPTLRDAILAHPTMAEGLGSLFSNVPARSVQ